MKETRRAGTGRSGAALAPTPASQDTLLPGTPFPAPAARQLDSRSRLSDYRLMTLTDNGREGGAAPAGVTLESIPRKGAGIVSRTIAGECLLIPVTRRAADMSHLFTLGDVSAFVWERIDGSRSLRSILADVLAEYDVAAAEAEGDLVALAAQLRDLGAVELA